jgi:hypothetical protein
MSTEKFIKQVKSALKTDDGEDQSKMLPAIEDAYEDHISQSGITKSQFLTELMHENHTLYEATVNHLFTPINWSTQKMRTLWAIKNMATGRLVTLGSDPKEENSFNLRESGTDDLDFAPMMTGKQEDATTFVKMLQQPLDDSPVGIGETLISLEIEQGVNPANLEVVRVKIIY